MWVQYIGNYCQFSLDVRVLLRIRPPAFSEIANMNTRTISTVQWGTLRQPYNLEHTDRYMYEPRYLLRLIPETLLTCECEQGEVEIRAYCISLPMRPKNYTLFKDTPITGTTNLLIYLVP